MCETAGGAGAGGAGAAGPKGAVAQNRAELKKITQQITALQGERTRLKGTAGGAQAKEARNILLPRQRRLVAANKKLEQKAAALSKARKAKKTKASRRKLAKAAREVKAARAAARKELNAAKAARARAGKALKAVRRTNAAKARKGKARKAQRRGAAAKARAAKAQKKSPVAKKATTKPKAAAKKKPAKIGRELSYRTSSSTALRDRGRALKRAGVRPKELARVREELRSRGYQSIP